MRMGTFANLGGGRGRKTAVAAGLLSVAVAGVCWSQFGIIPQASAVPPAGAKSEAKSPDTTPAQPPSDYSRRVVAYIYGNIPITREELGEYLIARQGASKLDLLINKRIIEHACHQRGIEVTAAEVEAAFQEDLKGMQVTHKEFVDKVLKHYNKTLYEWREDVLRPKLLMGKLVRNQVKVTDQDLKDAFEAHYGEKIDGRIILWPTDEKPVAMRMYEEIRKSDEAFDRAARSQANPTLAASGGRVRPISRHSTGNDALEKEAFSLQPGELSSLVGTPEGMVVFKCVQRIPPETDKKLDAVKADLEKEILDKKILAEVPKVFAELLKEAKPDKFIAVPMTEEELKRQCRQELEADPVTRQNLHTPAEGTSPTFDKPNGD